MQKTIISSSESRTFPNWNEIWAYRNLIKTLAWRDLRVKYAQTYIGIAWALINPVLNLLVLGFVFGRIADVDTGTIPHLLFTAAGLASWTYFSTLLSEAGSSIVGAQSMIKKIYFPRLVIPLSKALSGLVDYFIALLCLLMLMIYYGVWPGPEVIYLPVFLMLAMVCGLAGGILVSALSARYRDIGFVIPFLVRLSMFATPIGYAASNVPEELRILYYANPLAGIVQGFRWSLFGGDRPDMYMFYSLGIVILLFLFALWYFAKVEKVMADIL